MQIWSYKVSFFEAPGRLWGGYLNAKMVTFEEVRKVISMCKTSALLHVWDPLGVENEVEHGCEFYENARGKRCRFCMNFDEFAR